ncbi:MAG TPA: hypothetical protein VKA44_03890 [Gemmatimonadota bacterium]|nr:hypothetical protein [Gemmatimonadota bacterium]
MRGAARGASRRATARRVLAVLVAGLAVACAPKKRLELPSSSDLQGIYGSAASVELNGNVVVVRVEQSAHQLQRGGQLWAKVGPYIYLFSPQTRDLFQKWDGVAGVRVTTVDHRSRLVARATLLRDALTSETWKTAIVRVAHARNEGTDKPGYLDQLVEYGEDHTKHEYGSHYVSP